MQNLKHLNDISDETFNGFLKELSFPSKRFMVRVRELLSEQGVVLTSKSLKESFVSFLNIGDVDSKSDPLLHYLRENEDKYEKQIIRFVAEMQCYFFRLNSMIHKEINNKEEKEVIFSTLYDTLENTLLQLGYTFRSTEFAQQVEQQLSDLIYLNYVSERKLQPNIISTISFLQDMLKKLAERGSVSKKFQNESTQIRWIHSAFKIDFHNINQLEKEKLKIDWNNLNELANWLLFLKKYCIVYNHDNNKQLYDWVIAHVSYNGQSFSKGATIYRSLKDSMKKRQGTEGKYWCLDDNKQLKIKYAPHKGRV